MTNATIVQTVGTNFVKPSEAFIKLEPITSKTIAVARYKYFISSLFDFDAKLGCISGRFFDVGQNRSALSDAAQGFLGDAQERGNVPEAQPLQEVRILLDEGVVTLFGRLGVERRDPFFKDDAEFFGYLSADGFHLGVFFIEYVEVVYGNPIAGGVFQELDAFNGGLVGIEGEYRRDHFAFLGKPGVVFLVVLGKKRTYQAFFHHEQACSDLALLEEEVIFVFADVVDPLVDFVFDFRGEGTVFFQGADKDIHSCRLL